ncbi:MAG TPA: extracellular solute-binding protein [Gemmatimonadaceae bacterium]|nr:extracellular solute-binding protein [Gemmatimonadaceae bacterium]
MPPRPLSVPAALAAIAFIVSACAVPGDGPADRRGTAGQAGALGRGPLVLYNAAAIARPMRAVLDSFAARSGMPYEQETASSLELARKVLELGGAPDVLVLADPDIFPQLLEPRVTTWHALFARNRIVLAYTTKSRGAGEIDSTNWFRVLERPAVDVGRSDPNTDPSGYRTLLVWQLAERHYREPGLYQRMLRASPPKNVRPREADQVALLQVGEYDYIWTYQNLADAAGLRYVKLPDAVDLGNPADSATYTTAAVRVQGRTRGDSVTFRGRPILFAVSIPSAAGRPALAERFVAFLLSADGRRILRSEQFDALDRPVLVGRGAPTAVSALAAPP